MSYAPTTFQQLPIMNKVALRVRYPPDYQPEEEPVRLPLGLFNDLLQELQNISTRYLPSSQEFDPTSIALELTVRDKATPSGLKEAGKQIAESGIEEDENITAAEDEKSNESNVETKTAGGNDPASPKISLKTRSNQSQLDYSLDKTLTQTQPSETRNPNQEAKNGKASFRTSALQMRYLTTYQGNKDASFTGATQEGVSNDANAEKGTELDSRPPSRQPTEIESAPSTPSIPKRLTFPKIPGEIRMSESRWANENVSSKSRRPRKAGQNSRYGRGGSLSGGHSPTSSRQGSIISLPQSQEENWNRKHGRAQESSDWGNAWGSAEGAKQLKDGWGTDFVLAEEPQARIDGNGWGSDTAPAAVHREHGAKEISHDWGAKSGNDDYSHSRPARGGRGARGASGGNQEQGRLNTEFGENSSNWNSPSVQKHTEENNNWSTRASPQNKYSKNDPRDDWASTGPADLFAPRSTRGGRGDRGDGGGDYQRGGRVGPRGRGSWNGVAQSAYNRSTEVKAGIEPTDWGQENTEPSWGDDSNSAAPREAENSVWGQDPHDSDWGQPDVSKKSQDAGSPSSPAQDPTSTWDDTPGWQPSRFKKHEPKW